MNSILNKIAIYSWKPWLTFKRLNVRFMFFKAMLYVRVLNINIKYLYDFKIVN